MKPDNQTPNISSAFMHPVYIAVWFAGCIGAAFLGQTSISIFLGFVFVLTLCSYLWGKFSLSKVEYTIEFSQRGIFPGQKVQVNRCIHNGKALSLLWLECMEKCDVKGALMPDEKYIISGVSNASDDTDGSDAKADASDGHDAKVDAPDGSDTKADEPDAKADASDGPDTKKEEAEEDTKVSGMGNTLISKGYNCLYTFSFLKWHQTMKFSDVWSAKKRGIHISESVLLRSGDGFGLSVLEKEIVFDNPVKIAVYPLLLDISADKILNDMWDTRSSSHGYLEDNTLLRSVRTYLPTDSARRINQRLLARGQGLNVNEYEIVSPDSVVFILDNSSFAGKEEDAFEETMSILASLIVKLSRKGIEIGIFAPESMYGQEIFVRPSKDEVCLEQMMEILAAASPSDKSILNVNQVQPEITDIGQIYYVSYSLETMTSTKVLNVFPEHKSKILVYEEEDGAGGSFLPVRRLSSFGRVS